MRPCSALALGLLHLPQKLTLFWEHPVLAVVATSLFGLIPHCAASIAIAEGLVHQVIPFSAALAGLAAGAGYGPIVLVKDGDIRTAVSLLGICLALAVLLGLSGLPSRQWPAFDPRTPCIYCGFLLSFPATLC